MTQLPLFERSFWTVSEITLYLRDLLENDSTLQDLWVQGEISNLSRPSSGHLYFTLKDSNSALKCVMWRNAVLRLNFIPRDGQAIEVHGAINIYEVAGQYQLYADLIRPAGEGALYQEYLRLKARLEAEGLFAPERKRPVPTWPKRIGIITSPTGAALRDMLNTLKRRFPLAEVILAPTPVQGIEAPPSIVNAIHALNQFAQPDVILIARGGGSIEDLWAFNDERVARAIAASTAPVISGVGHETDFTIADFVSDLRAPTPTAAAELATPNRPDIEQALSEFTAHMSQVVADNLNIQRWKLNAMVDRLAIRSPISRIRSERQRLDETIRRSGLLLDHQLKILKAHLDGLDQRLHALNPLAVLQRGYTLVTLPDGTLMRSVHQASPGQDINLHMHDGQLPARILPS